MPCLLHTFSQWLYINCIAIFNGSLLLLQSIEALGLLSLTINPLRKQTDKSLQNMFIDLAKNLY